MNKNPQDNQQTEPKQCKSEVEEICICQTLESGRHSMHLYLKINIRFHAKNPRQQYLKIVSFVQ